MRSIADPARCDAAGVPQTARKLTSKSAHALDIVRQARARGMRFKWVGVDAGYGKEPAFLRALDAMREVFVADVHSTQRVRTEPPELRIPPATPGRGRPATKRQAAAASVTVEALVRTFGAVLTPRDIVEMLKESSPRKPEGRDALIARINQRHARRRGAIESRYRTQQKTVPP